MVFDAVYGFYNDIIGDEAAVIVKKYITAMFFIILLSNLLSVAVDFVAPIFGPGVTETFALGERIVLPTGNLEFALALSTVSTILMLVLQFRANGFGKFLHAYIPVTGSGYLEMGPKGEKSAFVYYPMLV